MKRRHFRIGTFFVGFLVAAFLLLVGGFPAVVGMLLGSVLQKIIDDVNTNYFPDGTE